MSRNEAQIRFEMIENRIPNKMAIPNEGDLKREGERPREPTCNNTQTLPHRHKPASGVFLSPTQPTIVLLNVCTHQRSPWLAQPVVDEILKRVWGEALAWLVGRYVLMPDHLHLFCAPGAQPAPLDRWVSYWKRLFTLQALNPTWRWQVGHWDTRLRRREGYEQRWQYVLQNPVRRGLVARAEDWPYPRRAEFVAVVRICRGGEHSRQKPLRLYPREGRASCEPVMDKTWMLILRPSLPVTLDSVLALMTGWT